MNRQVWRSSASSNIALIKYMGKTDHSSNRPTNASLSMTLPHLNSFVEIEVGRSDSDSWCPLQIGERSMAPALNERGIGRFLAHTARIKERFGVKQSFVVRSMNDFPADCGLASSASSFAALTRAVNLACSELTGREPFSREECADLSRQGSGSSCRSFFEPWSVWDRDGVRPVQELENLRLIHQVVIVDRGIKTVSSSDAHRRVGSSLLFRGRPERAQERVSRLVDALGSGAWRDAFEICWAEFWDMHALFETSRPPFGYMTDASLEVLRWLRSNSWDLQGNGPLITMDAGPNIHVLHRPDHFGTSFARRIEECLGARFAVVTGGGSSQ